MDKIERSERSKIYNFFHDIFFMYFLVPFIIFVVFCVFSLFITGKKNNVPTVFGYSLMTVTSGSMEKAGFSVNDKIVVKKQESKNYKVGDYIAFFDYADPNCSYYNQVTQSNIPRKIADTKKMVFHEIISIFEDENHNLWFRTKGTNNNHTDLNLIYQDYVIGEYVQGSKALTPVFNYITSYRGVLILIVLPCSLILFKDCMTLVGLCFELSDERKKSKQNKENLI